MAQTGTPATATLQVATDSTTPAGAYTVTVTAISGVIQQTLAVTFILPQLPVSPTFDLSAASSTLSVAAAGESVADMLTIRPTGGFTGTVQLSCTVSQAAAANAAGDSTAAPTCAVPATASVAGGAVVTATLTVNTTAASSTVALREGRTLAERIGGIAIGCLLLFMVPRRRTWMALGLIVRTLGTLGVTGCGSSSKPSGTTTTTGGSGTPAGGYMVTVTAASGSISTTTQVQMTVQ